MFSNGRVPRLYLPLHASAPGEWPVPMDGAWDSSHLPREEFHYKGGDQMNEIQWSVDPGIGTIEISEADWTKWTQETLSPEERHRMFQDSALLPPVLEGVRGDSSAARGMQVTLL